MRKDLQCPYCTKCQEVCRDDGYGCEENTKYEMECSDCGKMFTFTTSIIFCYEPEKADCLNTGEHLYKPTRTYPKKFTMMQCQTCEKQRTPTEKEMKQIIELECEK